MGTVHHIQGDEISGIDGVNEFCVEALEGLIAKANTGDVVGVSVAIQHADGATSGWTAGFVYNSRIIGELMLQLTRLTK